MTSITIELPESLTVAMRNGASVEIESAKLAGLGAELFIYGVGQKVRDSASGAAKVAEETKAELQSVAQGMMNSAVAALLAGEWSHRGEGSTVDPRVAVARSEARKAIKNKFGSKSPEWARFTGLSDKDQLAKLDEIYESNKAAFDPAVDEEMARREAKRKSAKAVAKKVEFNI